MLSDRSAHHGRLHSSWPTCRFNSFFKKCTTSATRAEAHRYFIGALAASCPGHCALPALRASIGLAAVLSDRTSSKSSKPRSWLVLPSHVQWTSSSCAGRVAHVFNKWLPILEEELAPRFFHSNYDFKVEDASILSVGVSWALPGRHFGQVVKSWNFSTGGLSSPYCLGRRDLRIQ